MNSTQKSLVTLLSAAIRGNQINNFYMAECLWNDIYEEAEAHSVHPLIYPVIKQLSNTCSIPNDLINKWSKSTIMNGICQTQHINNMKEVFYSFNREGIDVVALKGLVLRDLYPKPEFRTMSDSDLLIKSGDLEAAEKVLLNLGYTKFSSINNESCFTHPSFLAIDLHWSLSGEDHLKNISPFEDTIWNNIKVYDFYGLKIHTLSVEYEFIHLFIHIASHMIKSGFGVRQLCDIVVFIEHNEKLLDWNLVYVLADACKLNKLIVIILNICSDLLELKIPEVYIKIYPGLEKQKTILIKDIFDSGVYGKRDNIRMSSTRMLDHSLKTSGGSNFKIILRYLFPTKERLDDRYSYASKYSFLLIFAWIHRLLYELLFNSVRRINELVKLKSTSSLVKDRFGLIEWLQL